ncbi:hypothetical protein AB0D08_39430 [Kitasatospora sp. NPDC048540]|uniref:hypothetical protein n=1 Tax=unclassified Kitasatospora TaxID=2633591 RepID=UPI000539FC4E|nr:hypothetical protein [Kitasatospora sp. MBT63]
MTSHIASDVPSPAEAYANAPDLEEETTRLASILASRDLLTGTAAQQREAILRQAAVDDRHWRQGRDDHALTVARISARSLLLFDLAFPRHTAGPHRPDDPHWHTGPDAALAYLHQEYLAWHTHAVTVDSCGR